MKTLRMKLYSAYHVWFLFTSMSKKLSNLSSYQCKSLRPEGFHQVVSHFLIHFLPITNEATSEQFIVIYKCQTPHRSFEAKNFEKIMEEILLPQDWIRMLVLVPCYFQCLEVTGEIKSFRDGVASSELTQGRSSLRNFIKMWRIIDFRAKCFRSSTLQS